MTMQRNNDTTRGFSLTELIVVVAIISIMSASAVVGFRYMGDTLITKEAKGLISDTVKKAEMEIIREEYKKNTIYFLKDYLVIVSEPENKSLNLTFTPNNTIAYDAGDLVKTDGDGVRMGIKTVTAGNEDITNFTLDLTKETEWRYQLQSDSKVSDIIRFIHFNVNRDNPSGITTSGGENKTVVIEAPYGKKTVTGGTFTLKIISSEKHEESLIIQ